MAAVAFGVGERAAAAPPAPLDPQNWSFQDNLTWADYRAARAGLLGPEHPADREEVEGRVVLADFTDKPSSSPSRGLDDLGDADGEANNIPRDQVPAFYADFLNKPSATNNFQTMNRYWMEDSSASTACS